MSLTFNGLNGLSFGDGTSQNTAASGFGFKNRIINGDMRIAQRGTSFSFATGGGTNYYPVDRFYTNDYSWSAGSNLTVSNDTSVFPPGFSSSYKVASGATGLTYASGGNTFIAQTIEGYNIADCYTGNITVSFWARASSTGTYTVMFTNNFSSFERFITKSYTINAANTWEYKTITLDLASGVSSGTWNKTNGAGLTVYWGLGAHSNRTGDGALNTWINGSGGSYPFQVASQTQLMTNANATFYLTGVQVEKGSSATLFDNRMYHVEDVLCKRYYEPFGNGWTVRGESTNSSCVMFGQFKVEKRAQPSIAVTTSNVRMYEWGVADRDASTVSIITAASMYSWGGHIKLSGWGTIGTGTIYGMGYNTTTTNGHPFAAAAEL